MHANRTAHRKMTRRDFLAASTMLSALSIVPRHVVAGSGQPAPSDRIGVAHVGVGGMGGSHLQWFAGFPDVDTVALCDVDEVRLAEKRKLLGEKRPDTKADTYTDFRRVLERKDVDVVTCATPDHWHALIAILAFQAGKDVYGEKPLSYSAAEGRAMLANLERHKSVFQLGTQIHAGDNYHRVVELVRSGRLGKIHTVRLWKTGGAPDLGWPKYVDPPQSLDWDMWLGPAPYARYFPERCHFSYRYFFDYSGGNFADFWCHIADIAFWALEPKGLTSIEARGEVEPNGVADTPGWIDIDYKFKDLDIYWTTTPPDTPWAKDRSIGAWFQGDKGSLICDYGGREIYLDGETLSDLPDVPRSIPRSPGHQRNFLEAVKARTQPESNLRYARTMTLPMHLGLISFRLQRKLEWDTTRERFIGDPAADYLLSRPYRSPWTLPF